MKARLLLAAAVLFLCAVSLVRGQSPVAQVRERALAVVAARAGVSPRTLKVVHEEEAVYPLTSATVHRVKVVCLDDWSLHQVALSEGLDPIEEADIQQQERGTYVATYGKLERGLYDVIQACEGSFNALAGDLIDIAIWANSDMGGAGHGGAFRVYLPLVIAGPSSGRTAQEQVVDFLLAHGYEPTYVSTESPVVFASLPADTIAELQAQTYVAAIMQQDLSELSLYSAARTAAAPWTWERGITGSGIQVAVVEMDGVAFSNPYIDGSKYYIGWWPRVADHATQVAGMVASVNSTDRGIAYDAEILSANGLAVDVGRDRYLFPDWSAVAATDWAIDQGADVINCSFGPICDNREIASLDKYYDWVVWQKKRTVTVAAGNVSDSCPTNRNVTTPGKGYNVITVGSKDDMNTATVESDINDDRFSWWSLYVDPITQSDSRLKPEVIATGERIRSTIASSPWIGGETQGTSFAAPIVAGEAALMMQRAGWLKDSPEAVKAGIMATARWTKVLDDSGSGYASQDKIGEGAVDTTAADNSLINGRIQGVTLRRSDLTDGHYDFFFDGIQGQRIRVVVVWSSHPARWALTNWVLFDSLESDFDLMVISPTGTMWGSFAYERNYEIIEFVAPVTGRYTAQVFVTRWDWTNSAERLGFAWYSGLPLP